MSERARQILAQNLHEKMTHFLGTRKPRRFPIQNLSQILALRGT